MNPYSDRATTRELQRKYAQIEAQDFDYDYPEVDGERLNLHPKSDLTKFILEQVRRRKAVAHAIRSTLHELWRKTEWKLQCFVPLSSLERKMKSKNQDLPLATIIPYSCACLDTNMASVSRRYLRKVMHRYRGFGSPNATVNAILRERVISEYGQFFREQLHLRTAFRDNYVYGVGRVATHWRKHFKKGRVDHEVTELLQQLMRSEGLKVPDLGDFIRLAEREVEFEGTECVPIDPWNSFVDPSVTVNTFNRSEFFGYLYETDPFELLAREQDPEALTFNGKYARLVSAQGRGMDPLYDAENVGFNQRQGADQMGTSLTSDTKERLQPTVWLQRLIPVEWNLGNRSEPELWQFEIVGDQVITQCHRLDNDHGLLGVISFGSTTTGRDVVPLSKVSMTFGMQEGMDWLVRSRMHEVIATTGMFIYHPLYVDGKALREPSPMKMIPLKPAAYGLSNPIDSYIKQLQFKEATVNHWGDIESLMKIAKEADGTVDIIKGDLSSLPERPGNAGVMSAMNQAISRLAEEERVMAHQGLYDLAYIHASNIDQYMDNAVWVDAVGEEDQVDLREIYGVDQDQFMVSPEQMRGKWRVIPHDEPQQHPENLQAMTNMLTPLMAVPGVAQEIVSRVDPVRAFLRTMEIGGVGYMRDLLRKPNRPTSDMAMGVAGDEYVANQVQAGNMIPQSEAANILAQRRAA